MTQEDLATLLGLLAATILLTAWISWRTGDAKRDAWLITGAGAGLAVAAAALCVA